MFPEQIICIFKKGTALYGSTHKTVLEMFSGNGVACGLCRFSIFHVGEYALFQDNGADKMSRANIFPFKP